MVCPGVVRRAFKLVPSILQALVLVVCVHIVGQGILTRMGGAKYRFSKSYQASLGSNNNKVQKVIKYIDKNIPRYSPKPKKTKPTKPTTTTTTTTTTTPPPPPSLDVLEREQSIRLHTLNQACSKYVLGPKEKDTEDEVNEMKDFLTKQSLPSRPMWQNLYCSKEHQISFCPIFKAASTFLLKKLLMIAPSGKYDKLSVKHLETQANHLARTEFGYLDGWDKYPAFTSSPGTSIIFVRHPFERLLSAFRDKLEDPNIKGRKFNEYYHNKYGRRIVMHYRKEKITGPTFKYPRFSEFLNFIMDKDIRYDDEHWAPFYKECSPCHINFTFVGHFETLYWDVHLLANKTGLTSLWDDPTDFFQSSTSELVTNQYFSQVDRDVLRRLYKRYKLDFELFGYSPDKYIKIGRPGPDEVIEETKKEAENDKENLVNDEIVDQSSLSQKNNSSTTSDKRSTKEDKMSGNEV